MQSNGYWVKGLLSFIRSTFNVPSSIHLGNQDKKLSQMNICRRNCCLPAMDKEFTLGILLHRPCNMTIIHEEVKRIWCSMFRPRSELKMYYLAIFSWLRRNKKIKSTRLSESSVRNIWEHETPWNIPFCWWAGMFERCNENTFSQTSAEWQRFLDSW